ncbi:heavy metal transport/detoxification superfamily protein [Striga asiatica]|uniref:Heavy metal transport/detoxification superfamily protein n=1 Tax=Striga asiatica TaxID=4170 RepID=A0A5A7PEA4_STRAF|nr:heavy metal transport/detoxification superfamily protein [Striga asiatica]
MQSGVESSTVEAILDESTPVSRLTESPAVVTPRSYFPAPLVARERDHLGVGESTQIRRAGGLERLVVGREHEEVVEQAVLRVGGEDLGDVGGGGSGGEEGGDGEERECEGGGGHCLGQIFASN